MTTSNTATQNQLAERVLGATTHLLLTKGLRNLRTAQIAQAAETTESTLFRHFGTLNDVLAATYERAWARVNGAVALAAFSRPVSQSPTGALCADTAAIWNMRADPSDAEAALVAFLFMRRRHEILGDDAEPAVEQRRFEERLQEICEAIVSEDGGDADPSLLSALTLNFAAAVWLTWFSMPQGSSDITDRKHDLSPDEAQLGVLSIVERALRGTDVVLPR